MKILMSLALDAAIAIMFSSTAVTISGHNLQSRNALLADQSLENLGIEAEQDLFELMINHKNTNFGFY